MTRVLIVSHTTGYQLRAFNAAAERLGFELLFATDRCHRLDDPWQDRAVPVRFFEIESSVAAITQRADAFPIDGVVAVGDRPVVLAARAAEALGLRWHPVAGAAASIDKRRSRNALAAAGLPSPRFATVDARLGIEDSGFTISDSGFTIRDSGFTIRDSGFTIRDSGSTMRDSGSTMRDSGSAISDEGFPFPVVLKPLGLSGSRGVIRANDAAEFAAAYDRIRALLARPQVRASRTGLEDQILVEAYIDGREYAIEGVLTDGALHAFAIFDKPDPLEGPFFEETIYVTPSRQPDATQRLIVAQVQRAAAAVGLRHGPVHAECRVTADGEIYVVEIAARPIGGLCSRVLTFQRARGGGLGQGTAQSHAAGDSQVAGERQGAEASLEEVLLQHAVGRSIDGYAREPCAAAVMMIPIPRRGIFKGVDGEADARAVDGVTDVRITAKEGQLLEPLPEAGSYLGFIFARHDMPERAEAAVRAAHGRLAIVVSKALAVGG